MNVWVRRKWCVLVLVAIPLVFADELSWGRPKIGDVKILGQDRTVVREKPERPCIVHAGGTVTLCRGKELWGTVEYAPQGAATSDECPRGTQYLMSLDQFALLRSP
jgi:hypothetical protein